MIFIHFYSASHSMSLSEALQPTASEALTTLRLKGIDSTNAQPRPHKCATTSL